jgi:hypothetical protein
MPNDAQFRTLLRGKDVEVLHHMERDRKYTTDQRAMIQDEIRGRHTQQDSTGALHERPERGSASFAVRITDIDMPFPSMVAFMVKWSLASIPAFIILVLVAIVILVALAAFGFVFHLPTH